MKTIKLLVTALAVGCCGPSAQSLANTVTSLADDGSPGTLRAAVAPTPSGGTINFAVTGTITLTSGPLAICQDLNILGPGPASLIILGNPGGNRVCYVGAGAHVNISGLTISGGYADFTYAGGNGGGILNSGILSQPSCVLTNNQAVVQGGGIFSYGTLSLTGCTLSGNSVRGPYVSEGGAVSAVWLAMTNCTLAGNYAESSDWALGGAISASANTWIVSCTICGNSAVNTESGGLDPRGGGISGGCTIMNTIVAGNNLYNPYSTYNQGPDVNGYFVSQGYNLIGMTNYSSGWTTNDLIGYSADLGSDRK